MIGPSTLEPRSRTVSYGTSRDRADPKRYAIRSYVETGKPSPPPRPIAPGGTHLPRYFLAVSRPPLDPDRMSQPTRLPPADASRFRVDSTGSP